jgi:protein gp37
LGAVSQIEWTESTWNPVTGCTKLSTGCLNCYAERMARRLQAMGQARYANGFSVTMHEDSLLLPLNWRKPRTVFVNSMSDLFHADVPDEFILKVFRTMAEASRHNFHALTKRSERLRKLDPAIEWRDNIWMGVTVEHDSCRYRIDDLRATGAKTKFLSLEPLLSPLPNLDLTGIDWVIVGGESGIGARPMEEAWAVDIRNQCLEQGVPFFFKQWGGVNKKKAGRSLQGRTYSEMPG